MPSVFCGHIAIRPYNIKTAPLDGIFYALAGGIETRPYRFLINLFAFFIRFKFTILIFLFS